MSTEYIADAIATHVTAANALAGSQSAALAVAASRCVRCLLDERRLFVCGSGPSSTPAQQFALNLLGRLERERPGLPVFCLADNPAIATGIAGAGGDADIYARQLRALGQSGDVVVALSTTGSTPAIVQSIIAAHDRRMDVVAITGVDGGDMARVIGEADIEVRIPGMNSQRTTEIHLLIVNLLCELIERELFGETP